jgi:hypothetical protein
MPPQRLEKIESAPGNGMGSEASNPQDVVPRLTTDRARLRLTNRKSEKLRKKAPKALKSLDAELKSAPVPGASSLRVASTANSGPADPRRPVAHPEKRMDRTTGREIFLPARP